MTAIPSTEKIERIEELATEKLEKVRVAVNEKLDTAHQTIAEAAEELRETAELAGEKKERVLDRAQGLVSEKKQFLEQKTRHAADLAKNGYAQLREGAGSLGAKAKDFARENPIKSTALAVGLGIVTGLAVRQARS